MQISFFKGCGMSFQFRNCQHKPMMNTMRRSCLQVIFFVSTGSNYYYTPVWTSSTFHPKVPKIKKHSCLMRKKKAEGWRCEKLVLMSKLQISLMDCPCNLTNLSSKVCMRCCASIIVGKNEIRAQKWKIRANRKSRTTKNDEVSGLMNIWNSKSTRAELDLRISILLKTSFFEGNMMHDNFYEYFVGAEKHEFSKVPGNR